MSTASLLSDPSLRPCAPSVQCIVLILAISYSDRVTIDEIEAFVSIARLGGFARAAEALHRSQPAISRRIEMLEDELRTPIFERVRGGVVMTEAGRSFLPYAEAGLANPQDGTEAIPGLA